MNKDVIIVGAGYAGAVSARKLAEAGKKVLILESRDHIGGNAYDWYDENSVLRHEYGPHIFHTNNQVAVDFLSRFTEWFPYEQRVLGLVKGKLVPVPFNLTSIELLFEEEKASHLKEVLIRAYGMETKVPILKLRENEDKEIKELAEFIFEHIFKYYTMKQWGYTAEQLDPAVTARVPIHISYDDRYFQDKFQNMPVEGYTKMFEKMLDHENIEVKLGVDALEHIRVDLEANTVLYDNQIFTGEVIYTGLLDALLGFVQGELPYRSLWFDLQSKENDFQPATTVNYPTPEEEHAFTRISEYKKMMKTPPKDKTTIAVEYPFVYDRNAEKGNVPYYPLFTEDSMKQYKSYVALLKNIKNLHLLGRLAEYRYYNMDAIVARAIQFSEELLKQGK